MAYTYDDFLKAAQGSGLMGEFSQADLNMAQQHPEFGLSMLSLKKDYHNATTGEQRALAHAAGQELRKSYGNYTGESDGSGYISAGKIPGQVSTTLDRITRYEPFSYEEKAPTYESAYAKERSRILDDILSREGFSWSKEADPLWDVYQKQYAREGRRASEDTLGQVAAATGGIPSSYAVTAAAQAGDYYAAKASDMIPTLYQQAYDRYLQDYQMDLQKLDAVNAQEQLDYAKYLDRLTQHNTDRDFAYQTYRGDFDRLQSQLSALQGQDSVDYGRYLDRVNLRLQQEELQRQQAEAAQQRDAAAREAAGELARAQVDAMLQVGATPGTALTAASGYSNEYIRALEDAWRREQAAKLAASSSSGTRRTAAPTADTPTNTAPTAAALQAALAAATAQAARTGQESLTIQSAPVPGTAQPDGGVDARNMAAIKQALADAVRTGGSVQSLMDDLWDSGQLSEAQKDELLTYFKTLGGQVG